VRVLTFVDVSSATGTRVVLMLPSVAGAAVLDSLPCASAAAALVGFAGNPGEAVTATERTAGVVVIAAVTAGRTTAGGAAGR